MGEAGNSGKIPPGQSGEHPDHPNNGNNGGGGDGGDGTGGSGGNGTGIEKFIFYYHPDHLGSSSYITDANGEVTQHVEYFAFGETFLEEHSNTDNTPYLFNGKELDEETGLYYYGARYYDAKTSVWVSVDPLWEKYPAWCPYNFVLNNPINLIDPDGRTPIIPIDDKKTKNNKNNSSTIHIKKVKEADNRISVSPIKNPAVSSDVGPRDAPIAGASTDHPGMDIVQPYKGTVEGAIVVAPVNLKILAINSAIDGNGAGNRIHTRALGDGKVRTFMHLQSEGFGGGFEVGDSVPRGSKIGQVGNTGNSDGAHLHFEIRDNISSGTVYNPRNKNSGLRNAPTTKQARSAIKILQSREAKINRTPGHSRY